MDVYADPEEINKITYTNGYGTYSVGGGCATKNRSISVALPDRNMFKGTPLDAASAENEDLKEVNENIERKEKEKRRIREDIAKIDKKIKTLKAIAMKVAKNGEGSLSEEERTFRQENNVEALAKSLQSKRDQADALRSLVLKYRDEGARINKIIEAKMKDSPASIIRADNNEEFLSMRNMSAFPDLHGLMSDTVLNDPKIEAKALKKLLVTDDGIRELKYDEVMDQAKKFRDCYPRGLMKWNAANEVIEHVEGCKSYINKQNFHAEMCRLLTDTAIIFKAAHVRDNWVKGNPEQSKAPFHPEARIKVALEKRDYAKRIDLSNLGGKLPNDLYRKAKHHNYLCSANNDLKALEIKNKLARLKGNNKRNQRPKGRQNFSRNRGNNGPRRRNNNTQNRNRNARQSQRRNRPQRTNRNNRQRGSQSNNKSRAAFAKEKSDEKSNK